MRCPNCGDEYSDDLDFCPNCNTKNNSKNNRHSLGDRIKLDRKKVGIILAVVAVAAVLIEFFQFIQSQKNPEQFIEYVKTGRYDEADEIFNSRIALHDKQNQEVYAFAEQDLESEVDAYYAGTATYEEAAELLEHYSKYYEDLKEKYDSQIETLHTSQKNFQTAEEYWNSGEYTSAYHSYEKVIEEDRNYETAQQRIQIFLDDSKTQALEKAESLASEGHLSEAASALKKAMELLPEDSELLEKEQVYMKQAIDAAVLLLNYAELNMMVGETKTLTADYNSKIDLALVVKWHSDNSAIVSVDSKGKLNALREGEAIITAEEGNGKTAVCHVTVEEKYYTVDNLPNGYFLKEGDKFYPWQYELPEEIHTIRHYDYWNYWVEAEKFDESLIRTVHPGASIVYRGDTTRIMHMPYIYRMSKYGYAYGAEFDAYTAEGIREEFRLNKVKFVNGEEIQVYDFAKRNGLDGKDGIYFGNLGDSFTVGYYDGTDYKEKEIKVDNWSAISPSSIYDEQFKRDIKRNGTGFETTMNGYFEYPLDVCQPGNLYAIKIYPPEGGGGDVPPTLLMMVD